MKPTKLLFALIITMGTLFSACKKDDPAPDPNEEEVITTMELSFTPVGGGATLTYKFDDPDGPGGTAPTQDEIVLAPAAVYNVSVKLLNKTATPVEDITIEVAAEADAHRFYYEPSAGSNIIINGLNTDPNGVSLGITSIWTTTTAATGTTVVTLRHYPATPPNKLETDLVSNTKSATDINVSFATRVN